MHTTFTIQTNGPGLYEFTRDVAAWVNSLGDGRGGERGDGILTLFVQHTSCSLLIQENADPEVQVDLQNFFARLVPPTTDPTMAYLTHTYEGPDDMPAHIKASLLPHSCTIPTIQGVLALGTWQGIYLFEHRNQAHSRNIIAFFK